MPPNDTDEDDAPVVDTRDHAGLVRRIERLSRQLSEARAAVADRDRRLEEAGVAAKDLDRAAKEAAKVLAERDALLAERAAWTDERAIVAAGITEPEGIDLARLAYGRLAPEARPKGGLAEWLGARDTLPKGVAAYLPAPAAPPPNGARTAAPPPNAGARTAPAPVGTPDLGTMSPDAYRASRDAIWAELGLGAPPPLRAPKG